ncbi:hypothetical protein BH09MYX1_BH09MYX1_42310 [soil metagenome]
MSDTVLKRVRSDVARRGWHVVRVPSDGQSAPPFAYTIGLESTFDHPEVAVFGLNEDLDVMQRLLDAVGERVRSGERFAHGDLKKKLLPRSVCAFARFPKSAYAAHFQKAVRYHRGTTFRALQCIWPDPKKRLPWDPAIMTPLLRRQPVFHRPDASGRERAWAFEDPHSRWVFTTRQVVTGSEPIRFAGRFHENGEWQFICHTTERTEDLVLATLGWIVDRDPTVAKLGKLKRGECAVRAREADRWRRGALTRE